MASDELFTRPPDVRSGAPGFAAAGVDPPGESSPYSCPDCGGVLRLVPGPVEHFRCRVGHRYTREALDSEQDAVIESALRTALRASEEQASLSHRIATRAAERGDRLMEERSSRRVDDARGRAEQIRGALRMASVADVDEEHESG